MAQWLVCAFGSVSGGIDHLCRTFGLRDIFSPVETALLAADIDLVSAAGRDVSAGVAISQSVVGIICIFCVIECRISAENAGKILSGRRGGGFVVGKFGVAGIFPQVVESGSFAGRSG